MATPFFTLVSFCGKLSPVLKLFFACDSIRQLVVELWKTAKIIKKRLRKEPSQLISLYLCSHNHSVTFYLPIRLHSPNFEPPSNHIPSSKHPTIHKIGAADAASGAGGNCWRCLGQAQLCWAACTLRLSGGGVEFTGVMWAWAT